MTMTRRPTEFNARVPDRAVLEMKCAKGEDEEERRSRRTRAAHIRDIRSLGRR
jgi:hypothetical protein